MMEKLIFQVKIKIYIKYLAKIKISGIRNVFLL